jgi:copper oxidase (laccase) domain-containing protein
VGPEVAAGFDPADVVPASDRPGEFLPRPHVDLAAANRRQLLALGLHGDKIRTLGLCTVCRADQFFSYRREGEQAGRMLAFIGIKPSGD